jgi:hypothetical protein
MNPMSKINSYQFETSQFGISDQGIHLLRNRFNYQTITFSQVDSLVIEKGRVLKHWPIILLLGIGMAAFAVFYSIALVNLLSDELGPKLEINEVIVPLMPFLLGWFCIYFSLRIETIMKVGGPQMREKRLSLAELEKAGRLEEFRIYMKGKLRFNM